MSDAYLQVELDDATKQLLVINTHRGLYRYNRLAFGPALAPAIFQRLVENLVAGIPYVAAYLDDVIVTGRTEEEHLSNLKQVLSALNEHGMKLRLEKCEFFRKQVTYLGHVISAEGLKPSEKRVDAVVNFPKPENVKQLESFIGKLNYYGKFLPSFSTIIILCAPLNRLSRNNVTWRPCSRCGSSAHQPNDCHYLDSICYNCNKKGYISSACRSKDGTSVAKRSNDKRPKTQAKWRGKPCRNVDHTTCSTGNVTVDILTTTHLVAKPQISLQIAGTDVTFEVDTGESMSLVGEDVWQNIGSPALKTSNIRLFVYGEKVIPVKGLCDVPLSYDGKTQTLPLIVTNKVGTSLFALDLIHAFKLDLNVLVHGEKPAATSIAADCNQVGEDDHDLQKAIEQFPAVFAPGLGHCTLVKVHLTLKEDATPKFCKPRPVPFSRLEVVDKELERLEKLDVITHVDHSEWATPVVVVQKSNGSVRLCGDYKVTVNPQLHIDRHPILRVEELFAKLQGGEHFTKLDMSDAYLQVELDDATKQLLVINTHRGLYRYNRLAFGPALAPAIFQRLVENLVAGIPYVAAYLDDVIVTGRTEEEHLSNLKQVLSALNEHGMKLRLEKCEFFRKQVTYLGHVISAEGLKPSEKRVDAVVNFPKPENVKQLESFIGKLNYYGKFLPSFSTIIILCAPLNRLRRNNVTWHWSAECDEAYSSLKQMLAQQTRLVHYDPTKPLSLATDASPYGIGAVISQCDTNGVEHPIAFASKTLTDAEKNYGHVEKEALSIIYGVRKFHQYLCGRHFTLITDHKPLLTVFSPVKSLPVMTLQRLQRWALLLMGYDYEINYRSSAQHANADALSYPVAETQTLTRRKQSLSSRRKFWRSNHRRSPTFLYRRRRSLITPGRTRS